MNSRNEALGIWQTKPFYWSCCPTAKWMLTEANHHHVTFCWVWAANTTCISDALICRPENIFTASKCERRRIMLFLWCISLQQILVNEGSLNIAKDGFGKQCTGLFTHSQAAIRRIPALWSLIPSTRISKAVFRYDLILIVSNLLRPNIFTYFSCQNLQFCKAENVYVLTTFDHIPRQSRTIL